MPLLHPKYNHLGVSRKKKLSKKDQEAKAAHEKWLKSQGIKPIGKRHRLKGVKVTSVPGRKPDLPDLSNDIPVATPSKRRTEREDSAQTKAEIELKKMRVAPEYNKGALQYSGARLGETLKTNKRR